MTLAQTISIDRPWEALDRSLAAIVEPELPALAEEIIAAIGDAVPDYRRPMEGAFGRGVRRAIEEALGQFVELIGRPGRESPFGREVYRALGRGELRAGRRLDALQAAYRLGARIAWRRVSVAARGADVDPESLSLLAESIFAYIDEISAESVEGYAEAQAEVAGNVQRRRERLIRLLVSETPADAEAIEQAASEAGWALPRALAALACDHDDPARLAVRAGAGTIGARVEDIACLLVPDAGAPGRLEQLTAALHGVTAAAGPDGPWAGAAMSFAHAREALRLQLRGVLPPAGLVQAAEQLGTLMLFRDGTLVDELVRRRLEPLAGETAASRTRLEETLLAWLRHQAAVPAVAAELRVHRQTVRYRLGRLRELYGARLHDPEYRFELELALRARTAVARAGQA